MTARRATWQRQAVRAALAAGDRFVSAQALHAAMRDGGSPIGIATVYRALAELANDGEADTVRRDGESVYRACTVGVHHHHLICRFCGLAIEVSADEVEAWARRVAADHGFRDPQHIVDVFGTCAACAAG
ncbi:MAG: transcriptional repressor [Microbacteriaceae bacterium]